MTWIDKEKLREAVCNAIEDLVFDGGNEETNLFRIQGIMILLEKIENMMDAEEKK